MNKALTGILALIVVTACSSTGRESYSSVAALDSNADATYEATLCEALFALGAILADPDPVQDVTGTYAVFDDANERLRIIAYGVSESGAQALVLQLEGAGDFVSGTTLAGGAFGAGSVYLTWGTSESSTNEGIPIVSDAATFGAPATTTPTLALTDSGAQILRPTAQTLYRLDGDIVFDDMDCTAPDDTMQSGLDFTLELSGILAYADTLDPLP